MRKIVVLSFVSLGGVMQAPGGPQEDPSGGFTHGGWTFPYFDEALGAAMGAQMGARFDLLLGRKTYDIFAAYWPKQTEPFARPINEATKYVPSRTVSKLAWGPAVLLKGDVAAELRKLKQSNGPDLQVHGSGNLIQTLLKHDLVDELWLKVFPGHAREGGAALRGGSDPRGVHTDGVQDDARWRRHRVLLHARGRGEDGLVLS